MVSLTLQRSIPEPDFKVALSLAGISREPFRFPVEPTREGTAEIRGVTRSYLEAFREIFGGSVQNFGADPLSWVFSPDRSDTEPERFEFVVEPPGSSVELLGLLLPGLLLRDLPTRLVLDGSTHIRGAYLPEQVETALRGLLETTGGALDVELETYGFGPRGRGRIVAEVTPVGGRLRRPTWRARERIDHLDISVILAHLHRDIGIREIDAFADELEADIPLTARVTELHAAASQGNVMVADVEMGERCESVAVLGEKGVRAEEIGRQCLSKVLHLLASSAGLQASTPWAALLACAAGGGQLWTTEIDPLTRAVCDLAPDFLDTYLSLEGEKTDTVKIDVYRNRP